MRPYNLLAALPVQGLRDGRGRGLPDSAARRALELMASQQSGAAARRGREGGSEHAPWVWPTASRKVWANHFRRL